MGPRSRPAPPMTARTPTLRSVRTRRPRPSNQAPPCLRGSPRRGAGSRAPKAQRSLVSCRPWGWGAARSPRPHRHGWALGPCRFGSPPWPPKRTPRFRAVWQARLFWLVARVEGCPLRLRLASPVALGVCLAFDAGAVRSSGGGLLATEASDTHPWLAPGALARASWTLPGRVRLEASGGPSVPLVRYGLNYGDTASGATVLAYRLPAVAVATAVGVGYAFP
jgi:hypothetical protein